MNIKELGWWLLLLVAFVLVAARIAYTREPTVTLRATVSGNQEQPRVMYILPWQDPGDALRDVDWQGFEIQGMFKPIYRSEFLRELRLREHYTTRAPTDIGATDIRNR